MHFDGKCYRLLHHTGQRQNRQTIIMLCIKQRLHLCLCMLLHSHMMTLVVCLAACAAYCLAMGKVLVTNQLKQGGLIIISLVVAH